MTSEATSETTSSEMVRAVCGELRGTSETTSSEMVRAVCGELRQ